ncbi:hypothetical protein [Caudoviricetes sp.]|nr:hypothetical protein [Caudoviricetes sp.]
MSLVVISAVLVKLSFDVKSPEVRLLAAVFGIGIGSAAIAGLILMSIAAITG